MLFSDFATQILKLVGQCGKGQAADAEDVEDMRLIVNRMLAGWNLDRFNIYTISPDTYDFVANQGSYQIGPTGADFPTADRPVRIENAKVILNNLTYPLTLPLDILDDDEYAAIRLKTMTITWPRGVYPDGGFPFQTLYFWPVPTVAYQFELWTWKLLSEVAAVSSEISFPPGYDEAMLYNAAIRAYPHFQRPISSDIAALARMALQKIQSHNAPAPIARLEGLGNDRGDVAIDYLSGEPY